MRNLKLMSEHDNLHIHLSKFQAVTVMIQGGHQLYDENPSEDGPQPLMISTTDPFITTTSLQHVLPHKINMQNPIRPLVFYSQPLLILTYPNFHHSIPALFTFLPPSHPYINPSPYIQEGSTSKVQYILLDFVFKTLAYPPPVT